MLAPGFGHASCLESGLRDPSLFDMPSLHNNTMARI